MLTWDMVGALWLGTGTGVVLLLVVAALLQAGGGPKTRA
jgi:hypothetical protein